MASYFEHTVKTSKPKAMSPAGEGKSGAYIAKYSNGVKAVIKLKKKAVSSGKEAQREIPFSTHPDRELAYYNLAKLLGWESLVPETVLTEIEGKPASAQLFYPALQLPELAPQLKDMSDESAWIAALKKACRKAKKQDWVRLCIMDLIAGQRDRHANNVGMIVTFNDDMKPIMKVLAWDNACTFGLTFKRYHNVFHKFLFANAFPGFDQHYDKLENITRDSLVEALGPQLSALEVSHAYERLQWLLAFPYKLPYRLISEGGQHSRDFPLYEDWFCPFKAPDLTTALCVAAG